MPVSTPARTAPPGTNGSGPTAAVTGGRVIVVDDTPARRVTRSGNRRFGGKGWLRLISPLCAIGLWQAASSTGLLPPGKVVSPASIAHTAYILVVTNSPTYGTLQGSLLVSCERWAIGFLIGAVAGVLLGLVSGLSRIGETILDPILQALRSVPLLGLIPLFIIWFGIGELPKVLLVMLSALFLMYIETFAGIRGVDARLAELGQVLGLRRREMLRHIVLPGAFPQVLTGLRLSLVASLLALVVAEQINANAGLGFMITQAQHAAYGPAHQL
jgi:sulfonate transport system permease protein